MEFRVHDRAVYLPGPDALVCADLHVGRDVTSDVELRLGEHEDLVSRFEALLQRYDPAEAVIAGDLLHSFDRVPTGATGTVRALEGLADDFGCRLTATPGNHDTMLEELWNGPIVQEYDLGESESVVITHGHVPPSKSAEWYVVGHDHPTIEIEGVRRPCYLYDRAQFEDAGVLMVPSFSRVPPGVRVNHMSASSFQSPLVTDAGRLRPIVFDGDSGETHAFPPLGEFRRHL